MTAPQSAPYNEYKEINYFNTNYSGPLIEKPWPKAHKLFQGCRPHVVNEDLIMTVRFHAPPLITF